MNEKKLTQFTFYDFYAEIIGGLKDDEAGRMGKRICEYMFSSSVVTVPVDDKERFFWGNIVDVLAEDKEIELSGKTPKGLNRRMEHFTFQYNFYDALKLMDERQGGVYIKAICGYMFNNETPQLKSPLDGFFALAKRKLDLSKVRSRIGKKGGNTARTPVTTEQINAAQKLGSRAMNINDFLQANPQVKNDLFKTSAHLADGINWILLNEILPISKYSACNSLYQILCHYNEIIKR